MKNIVLAFAVAAAAQTAHANPIGPFDELLVFGDSLSDPGNALSLLDDTALASQLYPTDQFTDGDVWARVLEQRGASVTNFAFGGATAATDDDLDPDFGAQRTSYFNEVANGLDLGDNVLTAVFFGGNDLLPATTPAEVGAAIQGAVTALGQGIGELAASGLSDFIVFGLPNLGRLPGPASTDTLADDQAGTFASVAFNNAINGPGGLIQSLSGLANIQFFDTFAFLEEQIALANAAGVNTRQNCLSRFPLCNASNATSFQVDDPVLGDTTGFVFFDDIHPTSPVHAALADALTEQLAPVPLPAGAPLLLAALAAMGVASRRRVAARTH